VFRDTVGGGHMYWIWSFYSLEIDNSVGAFTALSISDNTVASTLTIDSGCIFGPHSNYLATWDLWFRVRQW